MSNYFGAMHMCKKLMSVVLLAAIFAVILCTSRQNPYTIPGNARISLLLLDSRNQPGVDLALSDTVGHTIKIGVCPFLSEYIDSTQISMVRFDNGNDSVIVVKKFSSDVDTQWFDFTFTSVKKCSVSVKAFIQGGTQYSVTGVITIFGKAVSVTISPAIDTLSVDSLAMLSVNPEGDGPFAYQWFHGSTSLTGKTGVTLSMSHLAFSDSGTYSCLVTDKWGDTATSMSARLVVIANTSILPPDSVKGIVGVSRIGGDFIFKWSRAANADSYVIFRSKDTTEFSPFDTISDTTFTNTIKDTAFYYYIVAMNSSGTSAPSQRIRSTDINTAPKWSHSPITISLNEAALYSFNCADSCKDTNGDAVSFQLVPGGPANDSIVGTTWKYAPSYADSGLYTVKIKAWDGTDSSILIIALHVVNVPRPPQPQPQTLSTNRNTTLQVTLAAIDPDNDAITLWTIDTQTTHGTTAIANSAQPNATYTPVAGFMGTDYFTFKASSGSLTSTYSAKVSIRVDTNNITPVISQKLAAQTLNKGDSLVLAITVNSDAFPAPLYSWYKAGSFLDSTRTNSWKKLNVQFADSGFYFVIVSNSKGRDSSGAHIAVDVPPAITAQPVDQTVKSGTSATFTVVASGIPTPTFQWQKNGVNCTQGSATTASLTINPATIRDTGTYTVTATNPAGSLTSSGAILTITSTPVITVNAPTLSNDSGFVNEASPIISGTASSEAGIKLFTAQIDGNGVAVTGMTNWV